MQSSCTTAGASLQETSSWYVNRHAESHPVSATRWLGVGAEPTVLEQLHRAGRRDVRLLFLRHKGEARAQFCCQGRRSVTLDGKPAAAFGAAESERSDHRMALLSAPLHV